MPDIISQLKSLKLHGMADSYAELQNQCATGATASMESSVWLLRHLLEAESTDRAIRSIRYQVNAARFPCRTSIRGKFGSSALAVDRTKPYASITSTGNLNNVSTDIYLPGLA